jgi:hypothetical protein
MAEFLRQRACVARSRRLGALVVTVALIALAPAPAAQSIDFDAGTLQGSVIWNGAPVTGDSVTTIYVSVPTIGGTYINPSGGYRLDAVPPGTYRVEPYANGCPGQDSSRLGTIETTVIGGATTTADLDITATAGRVVGGITVNGQPLPYPGVSVPSLCGSWHSTFDGRFSHLIPPGTYTAEVRGPSGYLGSFTFSVVAGQTTDVDFGSTPTGTNVSVELSGGLSSPGGIGLTFSTVDAGGSTVVVESGAGPPPPSGYRIVGLGGEPRYWDIDTTAGYSGPITVCIRYDITQVMGPETQLRLVHDAGDGFRDITTSIDTATDIICGQTTSLSPFAVVESLDATPPTLHLPSTVEVQATSAGGAVAAYVVTASDADPAAPPVTCSPSSGSTFPLGATTVSCSASDARGNVATGTFTVSVVDTRPPVIVVPANVAAAPTGPAGAAVTYAGQQATDAVDGSLPVTCSPAPGSTFGFGTTAVTCTATDSSGNVGSNSFNVTVTPFGFSGFQQPIDNVPAVNAVQAGATLPVKWKLQGAGGTTITSTGTVAAGWPKQTQVSCSTFTGMEDDVSGATTGATTLRYDEVGGQFVYNWQTPKSGAGTCWLVKMTTDDAGTCWRLEVMLVDGTAHDLLVKLK